MTVSVSFAAPVSPERLIDIRTALEALGGEGDRWEVCIQVEQADECWTMTITGPVHLRRVYHILGDARHEPGYLAAILRGEMNSFPGSPPQDFIFALAELARHGIPYDDTGAFSGYALVNGVRIEAGRLMDLYRREQIRETLFRRREEPS